MPACDGSPKLLRFRRDRRPGSHAPHQTAFVPAGPAFVNPPKVLLTMDHKQASSEIKLPALASPAAGRDTPRRPGAPLLNPHRNGLYRVSLALHPLSRLPPLARAGDTERGVRLSPSHQAPVAAIPRATLTLRSSTRPSTKNSPVQMIARRWLPTLTRVMWP